MQQIVVYKARPESVPKILFLLRKEGLNPIAPDNPDGVQQYYAGFNYLVRITVPEAEARQARSILADWEKSVKPALDRTSHQCSMRLAYILAGLGIMCGFVVVLAKWSVVEAVGLVLALSSIILFSFAYIYNRRKKRSGPRSSLTDDEEDQQSEYGPEDEGK